MERRKNDTPQKVALREMMGTYMKENGIKPTYGADVNSIMRDMMSIILEKAPLMQKWTRRPHTNLSN